MGRLSVIIFSLVLSFCYLQAAYAEDARPGIEWSTDNPADLGFQFNDTLSRVGWKTYKSDCKHCQHLVKAYNRSVPMLFELKYQRAEIQGRLEQFEKRKKIVDRLNAQNSNTKSSANNEGLNDNFASQGLNYVMALNELKQKNLPKLEAQIKALESAVKRLALQLVECEKLCIPGEEPKDIVSIGTTPLDGLPFKWQGPYPPVCLNCARLAQRLNELPVHYAREKAVLEAAIATAQAELSRIRLFDIEYQNTSVSKQLSKLQQEASNETNARMDELEKEIKAAQETLKDESSALGEIKLNFEATLAAYNECIKACPPKKVSRCEYPDKSTDSLLIGENSKVGSSADLINSAKGKAKGIAMGALNSLLGGGGGSRKSKGPTKQKDPTRKTKFAEIKSGETEIGMRAGNFKQGMLVSTEIDDAPGNGTFHIQWIEDVEGNRYLPTQYLIFSLYAKWKLTVSWTYDKYVDGKNVEHREWDEISTGTEHLGDFTMYFEGEEGATRSIWNQLGFGTAVKGVKGLGAIYDLPPAALKGPCPLRVVTHISQPSGDPVTTQSIVSYLSAGKDIKHINVMANLPEGL